MNASSLKLIAVSFSLRDSAVQLILSEGLWPLWLKRLLTTKHFDFRWHVTAGEATVTQSICYSGLWCCGWSRWAMVDIRGWKLLVQQIDFIINRHVTENIETDVREINLCYTKITLGHFPRMKASSKYANTFFFFFPATAELFHSL